METTGTEGEGDWLPLTGHILFASIRWKRINEWELQKSIQLLGGKLETFFSHEITCVLTDELPLPAKRDNKVLKRNQHGVLLSQKTKCSSIIDKAKSLGIQVMRIETFLTWLRLHVSMPSKSQAVKKPSKLNSITKLNGCFMKIENQTHNFSPMYKVYSSEPDVEFERLYYQTENSVASCSSYSSSSKSEFSVDIKLPKLLKTGDNQPGLQDKQTTIAVSSSEPPKNGNNKGKRHYCECCKMYFSCLSMHLKGPQHTKYVSNDDNFKQLSSLTNNMTSVTEFREKMCNISTSQLELKPNAEGILDTGNDNTALELRREICDRSAVITEVKPEIDFDPVEKLPETPVCDNLLVAVGVKHEMKSILDETRIEADICHSLTVTMDVKPKIDDNLNVDEKIEPAELEEKLMEIIKCKEFVSSDPLTEILKVEDFEYLNSEKSELGRILSQTYPSVVDEFPANESFSDKTLLKDELNFSDFFPSGMLPDNDRLFSSDLSDNESIQVNVQNIIKNVFDENPFSLDRACTEVNDSISSMLDDDLLDRTSEECIGKKQLLRNLYFKSWAIRPISDFKMLFIRCSVLERPENYQSDTWIAKNVTDTKLVLTRLRFGVDSVTP